jgi:hypothetical protein
MNCRAQQPYSLQPRRLLRAQHMAPAYALLAPHVNFGLHWYGASAAQWASPQLTCGVTVDCRAVEQVLTASMHTRTFKVNTPVALAAATAPARPLSASAAAAGQDTGTAAAAAADTGMADADNSTEQTQGRQGSGPLRPVNGQPRTSLGSQATPKQQTQPAYRPEKLVRTDHR